MKRNILFIMPAMLNGGAEKVLIDILKHFDNTKYNVSLLLECKEGPYINDIPDEVELIYLHKKNLWIERLYRYMIMLHCKWLVYQILCRIPLSWSLKGRHFDTIVSFMEGMAVKMHSYISDKANRNISWVHIDFKKKHWSLDFFSNEQEEYEYYQKMDKIIFVSRDAKDRFKEIFKFDDNKLEVVYNLIDCDEIKKLADSKNVKKNKFTICMIGRLNQQKRYDRAIEAISLLKADHYDFELWILGSGELETDLRKKVQDRNLTNVVSFKGFIKPVYPYLKVADLLLNTSESEGYPLTICEALCLGRPVVATNITGANEIISASGAGILVDETPVSIYKGLKRIMDDMALRKKYSEKAVEYSRSFSVQESMQRIYNLI